MYNYNPPMIWLGGMSHATISHCRIIIVSLLCSLSCLVKASDDPMLIPRAQFVAAEKALATGDSKTYLDLKEKLKGYPLYPYLEYKELRRKLSSASHRQVQALLDKYPDTAVAAQLRMAWLSQLGKQQDWSHYLKFYTESSNTQRQCLYLQALIGTGQMDRALPKIEPLWLVGHSQPDACDAVFAAWQKSGKLTRQLLWQRIELAMEKRETRLARFLSQSLSKDDKRLVDLWRKVYRDPGIILTDRQFKDDSHIIRTILVYGLKRMARRDPLQALSAWDVLSSKHKFEAMHENAVKRYIGIRLASNNHPQAIAYLDTLPSKAESPSLREWRIRVALQNADWEHVLKWINKLPKDELSDNWQYWKARALQNQSHLKKADAIFRQLASSRDYYGFLAADQLGITYALGDKPLTFSQSDYDSIRKIPGIMRAHELLQLNRKIEARREWYMTSETFSAKQLQISAKLADQWGWHDRGIINLAKAKYWHDLETRFPLAHRALVSASAHEQDIEPAWIYAVIRQESAFIEDAHSPVGAMGLMQLMPRTAKQVSRILKNDFQSKFELLQAKTNIQLGAAYLRAILNKLDKHTVLATAAYNAGPHRVKQWLPESMAMPADVWVELIPFTETREYVRRVLAYTIIYEQRLGLKPTPLSERMRPIRIQSSMLSESLQDLLPAVKTAGKS